MYRHNYEDWSSESHQISLDPGAAELQDDDKVDIHLFSLKVHIVIDTCYSKIYKSVICDEISTVN